MAEVVGFDLKFYQKLEGGRKPQIKIEIVGRLAAPFNLEVWHSSLSRLERTFDADRPERAEGLPLTELGVLRGGGAVDLHVERRVGQVAEVGEECDAFPQLVLAAQIEQHALR